MNKSDKLIQLLNSLPSDVYDNSPIPNATQVMIESIIVDCKEYDLTDRAIDIIKNNPSISLDRFVNAFCELDGFPELIITDEDDE